MDRDAVVTLKVSVDGIAATATITVDAVDREVQTLNVEADQATYRQDRVGEAVRVAFLLELTDNYGDIFSRPTTLTLMATSSGGGDSAR